MLFLDWLEFYCSVLMYLKDNISYMMYVLPHSTLKNVFLIILFPKMKAK